MTFPDERAGGIFKRIILALSLFRMISRMALKFDWFDYPEQMICRAFRLTKISVCSRCLDRLTTCDIDLLS